jgi:hypothetical protein
MQSFKRAVSVMVGLENVQARINELKIEEKVTLIVINILLIPIYVKNTAFYTLMLLLQLITVVGTDVAYEYMEKLFTVSYEWMLHNFKSMVLREEEDDSDGHSSAPTEENN